MIQKSEPILSSLYRNFSGWPQRADILQSVLILGPWMKLLSSQCK